MRRTPMTVAGAAVLLICAVAVARFFAVSAQDATPAPASRSPIR